MTVITAPLSKLHLSPLNVRQSDSAADVSDLEASIQAHGLLSHLIVHRIAKPKGHYGVLAGGRRLLALQRLRDRKLISADQPIDIEIRDDDGSAATELSIVENTARVALPPVEEFMAFAKLAADGADVAAIAVRFGTTVLHVQQRMRLGQLHSDVLAALAGGKITLDAAKAYAATTDRALQKRVFDTQPGMPYEIRAAMQRDQASAGVDRMLKLVTLDAYTAAGGDSEGDLFQPGEVRILDVDRLRDLYTARIEEERAALQLPDNVTLQLTYENIGVPVEARADLSDEQYARREAIDQRQDEITERLSEIADWDQDGPADRLVADPGHDQAEVDNLVAEQWRLEMESERIVDLARGYPDGPVIAVADISEGGLVIAKHFRPVGWRPDGAAAAVKPTAPVSTAASTLQNAPPPEERIGNGLGSHRDQTGYYVQPETVMKTDHGLAKDGIELARSSRRQTLAAAMLLDVDSQRTAAHYLTFVLARGMIRPASKRSDRDHSPQVDRSEVLGVAGMPGREGDPFHLVKGLEASLQKQQGYQDVLGAIERAQAMDWMTEPDLPTAFRAFLDTPAIDKTAVSALIATMMLNRPLAAKGFECPMHDALADEIGLDDKAMRDFWTPDAMFFSWLPKARRLDILRDLHPQFAKDASIDGNGELSERCATIMEASPAVAGRYGMNTQTIWDARAWVPPYMSFSVPATMAAQVAA